MFTLNFSSGIEFEMKGIRALDFCGRMGWKPLQCIIFDSSVEVDVPDWFVRAHAPEGDCAAYIDPAWLLPGDVMLERKYVYWQQPSPERAAQLMLAYLHSVQEQRIADLESAILQAIEGLHETREQFKSAALADIRCMLADALNPRQQKEDE